MPKRIFLSYRRKDTSGYARWLFDQLEDRYPEDTFLDERKIRPGDDWKSVIATHVEACEVLLAAIGPDWFELDPVSKKRRIDGRDDWVRFEIAAALQRGIPVIPVLLGGAEQLRREHELPRNIAAILEAQFSKVDASIDPLLPKLQEILGPPKTPRASAARSANPTRYLRLLREDTRFIDIRNLRIGEQRVHRLPIGELYTPLTSVAHGFPLQNALNRRRLILVGHPGAGKSTFLRWVAFTNLEGQASDQPFPILIRAASLARFIDPQSRRETDSPEWLLDYLDFRANEDNWGLPAGFFAGKLKSENPRDRCLLMVDGLDEAGGRDPRENLARLLERAGRSFEHSHIVVTTRPSAYGGKTELAGYETVEIAPLDRESIEKFAAKWCALLSPDDATMAAAQRKGMLEAINSSPALQRMAPTPVMLTALAMLYRNRNQLRDQRAELYEQVLNDLADARKSNRPPEQCLSLLQHLAYSMHTAGAEVQTEIMPYDAAQLLAVPLKGSAEAARFLEQEENDSGILIAREGKLRFWHRIFQEYLAAKRLAGEDADRQRLLFEKRKLYQPDWRETVLLFSGVLCKQGPGRVHPFLKQMLDEVESTGVPERARCVALIGLILRDLKAWKYEIEDPRYEGYMREVLRLFEDAKAARSVDFPLRLEVADALGQVGDPRLLEEKKWVRVEGGKFRMGAPDDDPDAQDHETPAHEVTVKPFWMGKYPVTVGEYQEFIEKGKGTEPGDWQEQSQYPNRPVVRVDWNQAVAYCRWAGGRLPTEAEWECAARGGREGVRYPWGPEPPDRYKANYYETGPKHVTPVGMYPEGATPSGIFDLAGNVWEWCEDWYSSYGRKGKMEAKVLRGGCWLYDDWVLRVSSRVNNRPEARSDLTGFRCVRE